MRWKKKEKMNNIEFTHNLFRFLKLNKFVFLYNNQSKIFMKEELCLEENFFQICKCLQEKNQTIVLKKIIELREMLKEGIFSFFKI